MSTSMTNARSWAVAAVGGLALVACVDGAPKPQVGTGTFGKSASPLSDDSAFSMAGSPNGTGGTASKQSATDPQGSSGMMAPAGAGGANNPIKPSGSGGMTQPSGGTGGMAMTGSGAHTGSGGMGSGGAAGAGSGGTTSTASAGELTVTFTSVSQGGRYSPQNVGAVWIETGSGTFVKTLKRWGNIRASHLTTWAAASGGWGSFFGGGNTEDKADAISGATLRSHQMHMLTWDMKDLKGQIVPDGKYKIGLEVADDNIAASGSSSVEFEKSASGAMVTSDQNPVEGLVITYKP